jgi:CubicO group peptidase (beta-lactamase class C family)
MQKYRRKRIALIVVAMFLAASLTHAETSAEKADGLLNGLIKTNDPGIAVIVAQNGKILFEKSYGLADLEHHVPVTSQTIFRIASVTKQFTAAAILKLQEQGKLSVKDKLSKYIPDFPRGNEVTVRELLNHTSGIHDYIQEPDFYSHATNALTTGAIIEIIKKYPYDFDPGTEWSYSNSGYQLLGYIIEKVSGQSYGDFLRDNFFQPLGMTNTGVYRAHFDLPRAALGYSWNTNGFELANWPGVDDDPSWFGGDGALYSTVEDLYRWNEGIFNGRVLDAASLKAAFTPVEKKVSQLNSGHGYGFGWFISRDRGLLDISHGGGIPGFTSMLMRLPDEKFTVVVLGNTEPGHSDANPEYLAYQLVDIYLADKLAPLNTVDTNISPESYDALTGRYKLQNGIITISRRGTHLFARMGDEAEAEIFPKSDTEFFWKGGEDFIAFTFVKNNSGKAAKVIFDWCGMELAAPRMKD